MYDPTDGCPYCGTLNHHHDPDCASLRLLDCGCPELLVADCGHQEGCQKAGGELAVFVWLQNEVVRTGTVKHLVKDIQHAYYCGGEHPQDVITYHISGWKPVSYTIECIGVDEHDWMTFRLTLMWDHDTESITYTIDGRA